MRLSYGAPELTQNQSLVRLLVPCPVDRKLCITISHDDLGLVFQWRVGHSKSFSSALSLTLTFRYAPSLHSPSRREAMR